MLSCKDVSKLRSQSIDRRLNLGERLGVRLHLLVCEACRRFDRQMVILQQAMLHLRQSENFPPETRVLTDEAKTRILNAVEKRPDSR